MGNSEGSEIDRMLGGKELYAAYGESTGWKNFQGNAMPDWESLPGGIRQAWGAVAAAVLEGRLAFLQTIPPELAPAQPVPECPIGTLGKYPWCDFPMVRQLFVDRAGKWSNSRVLAALSTLIGLALIVANAALWVQGREQIPGSVDWIAWLLAGAVGVRAAAGFEGGRKGSRSPTPAPAVVDQAGRE